jgi:hypothetical protein
MNQLPNATALMDSSISPNWRRSIFPIWQTLLPPAKKMRKRIKANKTLNEQLVAAYYTSQTIDVSPEMQLIIYRHWGPPHIDLPTNV